VSVGSGTVNIVEIGILGPLEVRAGGQSVQITGSRLRALLTRLAVDAPAIVTTSHLVDAVWPADPPAEPVNALQTLVSRLRRALGGPAVIVQEAGGYRLAVPRGAVDAAAFADLAAAGRGDLAARATQIARDTLVKALALWRGDPLADSGDAGYAAAPIVRLLEQRLDAQTDLIEAELQLGRAAEVISDLDALVTTHPLREQIAGQLMRALAASGRTADALAVYDRLREALADELGVDPGPQLQALQLAVLRGEINPVPTPSTGRRHSNLRSSLTSFIGRDKEVARVAELLENGRLVTIVGPGGAGKTRLAGEIATGWVDRCQDGVWLVELAPVTDQAAISQAMLNGLGMLDTRAVDRRERQARDFTEQLFDVLAEADCLLLVDNCEHLIGPVAALVDQLLASCPGLRVLTTSREPLGIVGESLCLLPPLGLPPDGVIAVEATTYPAVQLLVQRAQAVSAGFIVDEGTVGAITEIVRRLDGLPLAIELAAARLRVMPIGEIAVRLTDRFRLLTGGSRTAMPRHRTLRAVVEWSWDLLAPAERLLAERLAVFPAGATVESATAVCADDRLPAADVSDLLLALVDKSLLTIIDGNRVRYRMLETIREYGAEQLAERAEAQAARIAHARYFAGVAAAWDPLLRTANQLEALAALKAERDNILAGLRYLAESPRTADRKAALDLALSMAWYWTMIGASVESAEWLGLALHATEGIEHPGRIWARAARAISNVDSDVNTPNLDYADFQASLAVLFEELQLAAVPPTPALGVLKPMLAFFSGNEQRAEAITEEILNSADGWVRAAARMGRAGFAENEGQLTEMRDDIDAAYADFEQIGDRWGLSTTLTARGNIRAMDGDNAGAIDDYERALRYAKELGSADDDSFIQLRLAGLRLRNGELVAARATAERVRADIAGRSQGLERGLFVDGILMTIALQSDDLEQAAAMAAQLRERLAAGPRTFMHGHMAALVGTMAAMVAITSGDLSLAISDLTTAYPLAVGTQDLPIVSNTGVAVAALGDALGQPAVAAEILGAAARLRGSDDQFDPPIAKLTAALVDTLGGGFDERYARGTALNRAEAIARLDPALLLGH